MPSWKSESIRFGYLNLFQKTDTFFKKIESLVLKYMLVTLTNFNVEVLRLNNVDYDCRI